MAMSSLWKPHYEVGVPWIDEQHRYIFSLTQRSLQLSEGQRAREARATLLELLRHVAIHFEAEEHLMAAMHYPQQDAHQEAHRQQLEQLDALVQRHLEDNTLAAELVVLLVDWVDEHIANHDSRLASFLKERPNALIAYLLAESKRIGTAKSMPPVDQTR